MDFQLSEEQVMIQDSARHMVERQIQPILDQHPGDRSLSKDAVHELFKFVAQQGLTAPRVPESEGGTGLGMLNYGLMFEQLPAWFSIAVMANEVTFARIHAEATPEQRKLFLPPILEGKEIGASATSEPGSGSDPRAAKTYMKRDGGDAVINGRKIWISNGSIADTIAVACRTDEEDHRGRKKLVRVIVRPEDTPIDIREIPVTGLQQGHLSEAVFEDVRVPAENILDFEGDAAATLTVTWNGNRPLVGLTGVGLAQRAFEMAKEYALVREQFNKPIGQFQLMQKSLADMETLIVTSRLLCYNALDAMDRGERANGLSAMAKRYACESSIQAISLAMNMHGGMGITQEMGIERMWRDARMLPVPDGTPEILALIQGRELTGLDAFRR